MQVKSDSMIWVIDVSHYNEKINWDKVKASGVQAVIIKSSEGIAYIDPKASEYANGARAVGIPIGFYHFARPESNTSNDEAYHFSNTVSHIASDYGDLLLWLDIETPTSTGLPQPHSDGIVDGNYLSAWSRHFIDAVKSNTSKDLGIYTGTWFINQYGITGLSDIPLWVANYSTNQPPDAGGWTQYAMFQYSEHGSVPGITGDVDMNVAVSLDALKGIKNGIQPFDAIRKVIATQLNMRSGPGIQYDVVGGLSQGQLVHITKITSDHMWAYTDYGAGGWIRTSYLGYI